ncbi:hypothetical protein C900_04405 [Fulvivirga imtechensis AK7]|uniref:YqaE/Pmp3 family membrane protein n=1 Tax=Fulvivirga imtechensis AK7 TaxID=1237149 RepID=L8JMJ1_9BACT|nr:YqaE/Pmp3 family membrane protein [Fulvivirga imtechensis]ELR70035.1 hypothetical protein C900_04405 [Fulvivirga imtechensis AK7]
MKKFTILQLLTGSLLLVVFYSCAPKYGAHFTNSGTFYQSKAEEPAVRQEDEVEIAQENTPVEIKRMEAKGEEPGYAIVSKDRVLTVVPNPSIEKLVKKHKERVEEIESSGLESKATRKELRKEKKRASKEIRKAVKEEVKEIRKIEGHNESDQYVLMMILAVLIPPLAVGLTYGIVDKFWISLLLTLLFWLPGAIYSLIVVNNYYK